MPFLLPASAPANCESWCIGGVHSVGVNLSNAGGFIRYELDEDRAVLFSTNLHVSHELSRDFKIEATAGVGADTDGRESLQGSLRLHKAF